MENSIQKLIQKFKFGFIQFNKIFIQLENQGNGTTTLNRVQVQRTDAQKTL